MSLLDKELIDFKLEAYHNNEFKTITKKDIEGKWAVFFFYPADFTFVCPTELEDLAEKYDTIKDMGVEVFSVSTDTHFVHAAWHNESSAVGKVKFPMIGDPTAVLGKFFDVYNSESGLTGRGTYLINPEGKVVLYEVNADGVGRNSDELVRKIQAAQFVAKNGVVCPAKWKPGSDTLNPGLDLIGKI
ncbi:MAG: alkyl hydroperoxide reductase subunit C [Erysipelotrichaceae bacterium]|nr:alkyl hydroperoxide reductase subunit C [Erysipelotrichaceae bacterium]MDO5085879.1 alkyl hydroperoxide reductase subunit C [Erysipelotrichaceae bacterium]